jgi:hypothetical protein
MIAVISSNMGIQEKTRHAERRIEMHRATGYKKWRAIGCEEKVLEETSHNSQ